jgi:hypothetical protein
MKRFVTLTTAALLACIAQSAAQQPAQESAQTPLQQNDWSVETVTVTAKSTGPAVWHVIRGAADVAILGVVEPLPEKFMWNTKPLEGLLDGAHAVLLPPQAQANIFQGVWFLLTQRELLGPPAGKTLWDVLPPSTASRFAMARDMLHQDKDRYDDNAPAIAALRLEGDYLRTKAMTFEEPADVIRRLARARGITVRRVATYDAMPSVEELLKLPPATTAKCVDAAVNDVDIANQHATPAAEAWAVGDIDGIKANFSQPKIYECLLELSPLVTALDKRAIDDTVRDITAELDKGDHAVAVVSIGLLLRKNGVMEKLLAAGVTVEGPKE